MNDLFGREVVGKNLVVQKVDGEGVIQNEKSLHLGKVAIVPISFDLFFEQRQTKI